MLINPSELSPNQLYHTMIQTIIPRPIAWVLSDNGYGDDALNQYNLAPFSYFSPVSSEPPVLMISVGKKPNGELKDTRLNIIERRFCVVHIAQSEQAELLTASSASLPREQSEIEQLQLATQPFDDFALPRLSMCKIAYACELMDVKDIGPLPQAVIFLSVKKIYIADDLIDDNAGRQLISATKIDPLARLGGDQYWVGGSVLTIKRPL